MVDNNEEWSVYSPDGCGGHSLVLGLEPDLLHGHVLAGLLVDALVHDAVRPLADLFDFLEVVHLGMGWGMN